MNTITTTTASSATDNDAGCLRPLPAELDLVSIAEMTAQFDVLATTGVVAREGSAGDLLDRMEVIELAAGRRGICSVRDMVLNQDCLLRDLAEFEEITGPSEHDTSEDLHIYRNLMLAIAVSAAESVECSVAGIYAQFVRLGPRACASSRVLADDEILLLRTMALVEHHADPTAVVPVAYALMDAGLSVEEIIHFAAEDFYAPEETLPLAHVFAWGGSQYEPEKIRCDLFASYVLLRFTSTALELSPA